MVKTDILIGLGILMSILMVVLGTQMNISVGVWNSYYIILGLNFIICLEIFFYVLTRVDLQRGGRVNFCENKILACFMSALLHFMIVLVSLVFDDLVINIPWSTVVDYSIMSCKALGVAAVLIIVIGLFFLGNKKGSDHMERCN